MPGIFKDRFYDSALGAVVSNGFIAPAACVFIAAFGVGLWWILLIVAGFMGIEETFILLGIYEHHWWKSIYSAIGFTVLFLTGKWLWHKIHGLNHPYFFRLIVIYLINVSLQGSVFFFYIVLFHQIEFHSGWFEDPSRDTIAFATLIVHIDSILYALVVSLRAHWFWKASLIAVLGCCFLWLMRLGILFTSGIWPVIVLILLQIGVLLLLIGIHRILTEKSTADGYL
ncbi:hypothetical protein [Paenibacillus harenae]|uniref:hypothetical protein n=1 Tax=Paenibacillus harenae TaxID=306543 RepID=UPI00279386E4|nr:hypothetical protein [Paenibacillus harenae]MDQ0063825.1 hypothetical protein [Paenibacillus harenae]